MSKYHEIMKKYCDDVLSGKIAAGVYTIKAIKRYINDLKREKEESFDFFYSQKDADILCEFAESLKPADLNGECLKLLPWQVFCMCQLEGWRHKNEPDRKRYRTGYIEVARKNGKTTGLLLPLTLFNFIKYPASESYLVSSRDDLAEKTYKEIVAIINEDPALKDGCTPLSLAVTMDNSRLAFFCDGAKDTDGFKPRFYCLDEYHAYATDKLFTSMQYGTRSKKDAQGVIITTADVDVNVPCYDETLKARRILNELQTQEDYFCIIYAIDEGDDYQNPQVWQKANPSLYDIIDPSVIESDINDAQVSPEKIPELKAKTFNIWGGGGKKSWIPLEVFQKNKDIKVDFDDFENMPCCSATDLSNIDDLTVYSLIFQHEGKEYLKHRFYIPEAMAYQKYKKENINFFQWIDQGFIKATPGNTVNYDFILYDFLNDAEIYKILALGYDKWQSHDIIEKVEANRPDILLIEIEQSLKKLSPMTKSYEKAIKDGLIVDNNPVMAWMINNAEIRPDPNGNYKPMKPSKTSTRRIDGVITSIMCHGLAHNPEVITPPPTLSFNDVKSLF